MEIKALNTHIERLLLHGEIDDAVGLVRDELQKPQHYLNRKVEKNFELARFYMLAQAVTWQSDNLDARWCIDLYVRMLQATQSKLERKVLKGALQYLASTGSYYPNRRTLLALDLEQAICRMARVIHARR